MEATARRPGGGRGAAISAFEFGGIPKAVLTLAQLGRVELSVSAPVCEDVEVLEKKFSRPAERIVQACSPLWSIARMLRPRLTLNVDLHEEDNRNLECAVAVQAQAIVTGDEDLRRLRQFSRPSLAGPPIRIVKTRAFLANRFWEPS